MVIPTASRRSQPRRKQVLSIPQEGLQAVTLLVRVHHGLMMAMTVRYCRMAHLPDLMNKDPPRGLLYAHVEAMGTQVQCDPQDGWTRAMVHRKQVFLKRDDA